MTYAMHSIRNKALVIMLATLMAVGFMAAVLPVPGAQADTGYFFSAVNPTATPMGSECVYNYGFYIQDDVVYAKVYLQEATITYGGNQYTGHIDSFKVDPDGDSVFDKQVFTSTGGDNGTATYQALPGSYVPVQIHVAIDGMPPQYHPTVTCYIVVPPKTS